VIKIIKSNLTGEVSAISSKSYAHRLMIAAFLTGVGKVNGVTFSDDIQATVNVLKSFGGNIERNGNEYIFNGAREVNKAVADCIESGSTLRFCIPLALALGIETEFIGSKRLLSRPNQPLFDCLILHGAEIDGYRVKGKLVPGRYVVDGTVSSQYITGLLTALPILNGDSEIVISGAAVSAGYIDITLDVLKRAGIKVERTAYGFYVYGNQKYNLPSCSVPGDWSNAAFFLSAGALPDNEITVKGLTDDRQGDKKIIDCLKKFGAEMCFSDGVTVKSGEHKPLDIDLTDIPDLAPILSVLCASADGKSVLRNVGRLKIKESDRLSAIMKNLSKAGVESYCEGDDLIICGTGKTEYGIFNGYNDHRMVMSAAILASISGGEINGEEAVRKSYPDFFKDYKKVGGKTV